jgi:hypothetical protein
VKWMIKTDLHLFETEPEPQAKYVDGCWDYLPTEGQPQVEDQNESQLQLGQRVERIENLVAELKITDPANQPVSKPTIKQTNIATSKVTKLFVE